MRAAAVTFVVAFVVLGAACSDVGDRVDTDPLTRGPTPAVVSPGHGLQPGDEIIDVDLFPFLEGSGGGNVATPDRGTTPCTLDAPGLQTFADDNLACATCYAMACGGEVVAHVCTRPCDQELPND